MNYVITLYVFIDPHTYTFTLTRNATWSDLCSSIHDRSGISVTSLYHRNNNGDIQVLSGDDDWKTLVYSCNTSWLQLSIDSTIPRDDILITQQDGLGINTTPQPKKTCFTTQFEIFGKLMDKYSDIIQSDDDMKTMMHQTALQLTFHQTPSIKLAEIEARLEKRLGNATAGMNKNHSAINSNNSVHDLVSLAPYENYNRVLSRSATLPSAIETVSTPLHNHVKRTPTAPSYSTYNKYTAQLPTSSPSSCNLRQAVKGTILGEWPAYSSLYPPPQPTQHDAMNEQSSSLSFIDSNIQYDHQESPLSLYPQPPTMTTTQSDRTSHSTPKWALTSSPPSMKPDPNSNRPSFSHNNNNDSNKHLSWYDEGDDRCRTDDNDPWKSSEKRQSYKEQHRALKSQQKELERAIRHLKRQEKLEKQEYRKKSQQQQQQQQYEASYYNSAIRKSSSLSSLSSSTSSIYSGSSALNDPCLQHQNHRLDTTFYFPTTLPSSSTTIERPYRNIINKVDDQHQHYGLDNLIEVDKTSHDTGGMTFLADTLDRLSMNGNTSLDSYGPVAL